MSHRTDRLTRRERPAADADRPAGALVLLHGRGADGDDLVPLFDLLDPEQRLHCVTLQAPLRMPGEPGWHWYVVRQVGFPDVDTFTPSLELVQAELAAIADEHDLRMADVVVGGFSQGAVMSIAASLGGGLEPPAAVLPWSGFVPTVAGWELDRAVATGVGVVLTHGVHDPVIPVEFGRDANVRLAAAGANVEYREAPMGHEIDPTTVLRARELLTARFAT